MEPNFRFICSLLRKKMTIALLLDRAVLSVAVQCPIKSGYSIFFPNQNNNNNTIYVIDTFDRYILYLTSKKHQIPP